jgi:glycosyltransferase involved in cell wall biosynthesis
MSQFKPAFEAAGATVIRSSFFDEEYLQEFFSSGRRPAAGVIKAYWRRINAVAAMRADLIWVEKEVFPYFPSRIENVLGLLGRRYAVDIDDAIFHNYDLSANKLIRGVLSSKLDRLFAGSSLVSAGNRYLADYAARHGATQVEIIPTVVDAHRYSAVPPQKYESLRIGWIGTPANTRYLRPVVAAIKVLRKEFSITLVTVGAEPIAELGELQENHAWTLQGEAAILSTIDIGVMPLDHSPWEEGKCGYKLIQYMAAGRPVIASPTGANCDIVSPAIGAIAETDQDWADLIRRFYQNPDARRIMGGAARSLVEQRYSTQAVGPKLVRLIHDAITRGEE